jgi:hypothetical protein
MNRLPIYDIICQNKISRKSLSTKEISSLAHDLQSLNVDAKEIVYMIIFEHFKRNTPALSPRKGTPPRHHVLPYGGKQVGDHTTFDKFDLFPTKLLRILREFYLLNEDSAEKSDAGDMYNDSFVGTSLEEI